MNFYFGLWTFIMSACILSSANAQVRPEISFKHLTKINQQEVASKKLALYRKYFRKDSIKYLKKAERYLQFQSDSITETIAQQEKALIKKEKSLKDGVTSKIYNTVYRPWSRKQSIRSLLELDRSGLCVSPSLRNFLRNYFEFYFLSASQNETDLLMLTRQFPGIKMPKALTEKLSVYKTLNPDRASEIAKISLNGIGNINKAGEVKDLSGKINRYDKNLSKYRQYSEVLSNNDTIKGFAKSEITKVATSYIEKGEDFAQVKDLKSKFTGVDNQKKMFNTYQAQAEEFQDSAYVKAQAKEKAEDAAMKYVASNPEILKAAQSRMNLLMKKFSVVPNSNDLSSAVKRISLKGKIFFERLQVAANFQIVNLNPLCMDLAPQLGYRLNSRFILGIGGLYRKTFKDSVRSLAPNVFGYKAYATYEIINNIMAYAELGRNTPGVKKTEEKSERIWENILLAGIGRKFRVNTNIEMTMMVGYNFAYGHSDAIYPQPWIIRVGFQTSSLAFLNKNKLNANYFK